MEQGIQTLHWVDWIAISVYVVVLITIGMLKGRKLHDDADFFLAGRQAKWPMIGFSIFASNISAEHLVGLAGAGYMFGLLYGNYEWMATGSLLLLALVFAPYYLSTKVSTMPEFLERRYSRSCRDFLAWLNVITTIFIRLGVSLYAGGLVIHVFLGWPIGICILILSLVAASYTIVGGLAAVMVTEMYSAIIMIIGSLMLTFIGLSKVGGISELTSNVPSEFWSMLRPADDPEMPWYAIVFGYPVLGIWYWCTDQLMVQRVLGARSLRDGQLGVIFAGFLKILPVFIFVLPGTICYVMYPGLPNGDLAYTTIITNWLPIGFKGIMIAVLIAALLSTMDAGLNSISTIFTLDIFKRWFPDAGHSKLLWTGRIATAGAMVIAVIWSPVIAEFEGIFKAIAQLIACVSPPLTAIFLLGVFWRRTTARAAELALWIGEPVCVVLGVSQALNWPENLWPEGLNFLFLAFLMMLGIIISMIIISYMTSPPKAEKTLPALADIGKTEQSGVIRIAAISLMVVMIGLYIVFR